MFKDVIECYQAIGSTLASAAKDPWTRIVVEAALAENRIDATVTYWANLGAQPTGYLTGVPMLARYVSELARLVSSEEKGLFKSVVFELHKNGKYDVRFEY